MLTIGDIPFDPAARRLLPRHGEVKLSLKAAAVLTVLVEVPGQVWSREALLERVWPGVDVGEEVLTHAIAELRRGFGDDFRTPRYIGTVHKSGYRLLAKVQRSADDEPVERAAAPSFDLQSYARYLTANELYERGGRSNTHVAISLFSEAIAASPGFALAHAGLAKATAFLDTYYDTEAGSLERALNHCEIAHRLASGSSEAFAAQGFIYAIARRPERSEQCFAAALQLNGNNAETYYLIGRACQADLDFAMSAVMFERAAKLREDDYHSLMMAGKVREAAGEEQRARTNYVQAFARIEQRQPIEATDFRAICCKARCLWQLGRLDEAHELMDLIARHPDPMNYHLACTFARAGRSDDALRVLEQVVELGWRHATWLERDPDFDALRTDDRFRRIAASIN